MWHDKIIRQFNTVPPNPSESDYLAPYNKLLNSLFPPDSDFVVVPHRLQDSRDSTEFVVMFDILWVDKPVLIFELKPLNHRNLLSKHHPADQQLKSHMIDTVATCPLETLHAVSALGTNLCFYSLRMTNNDAKVVPVAIPPHPTKMNDTAPADRWDYDILEPAGEEQFRWIVQKIIDGCAALNV